MNNYSYVDTNLMGRLTSLASVVSIVELSSKTVVPNRGSESRMRLSTTLLAALTATMKFAVLLGVAKNNFGVATPCGDHEVTLKYKTLSQKSDLQKKKKSHHFNFGEKIAEIGQNQHFKTVISKKKKKGHHFSFGEKKSTFQKKGSQKTVISKIGSQKKKFGKP